MDAAMRKSAAPRPSPKIGASLGSKAETWIDRETAGSNFKDERLCRRFKMLLKGIGGADGKKHSFGVPGLGEHEGGISSFQMTGSAKKILWEGILVRPRALCRLKRHRSCSSGYDRIYLSARAP